MSQSKRIYNINVGVLGHVDSGKTSLGESRSFSLQAGPHGAVRLICCCRNAVAALSTQLSTAALDKHPQSKERGITLDLGFSSFTAAVPDRLKSLGCDELQFTLVDCPGHASLIRTIIGGAQIIDMMLLVIDITKGIQVRSGAANLHVVITLIQWQQLDAAQMR